MHDDEAMSTAIEGYNQRVLDDEAFEEDARAFEDMLDVTTIRLAADGKRRTIYVGAQVLLDGEELLEMHRVALAGGEATFDRDAALAVVGIVGDLWDAARRRRDSNE